MLVFGIVSKKREKFSPELKTCLRDILYPNEKESLADKYKSALDRIGTLANAMQPKQKSQAGGRIQYCQCVVRIDICLQILECMYQAGFAEDDLRDMG